MQAASSISKWLKIPAGGIHRFQRAQTFIKRNSRSQGEIT
jgi:hypothetical protein